jgi:hypothetical protein
MFVRPQLNGKIAGHGGKPEMGGLQSRLGWTKSKTLSPKSQEQNGQKVWLK